MRRARIHLVRHGEVDPSWRGRIYGGHDVPLAAAGRARFDALADQLAHLDLAAIYCSELARARDGAERLAAPHGLTPRPDARLNEIDRGEWTSLSLEQIEQRWPGGTQRYLQEPGTYRDHGGESHAQLLERVLPALEEIADRHGGEQVLVVGHGQVMRVVVSHILAIPGDRSLNLMTGHGGITTVDRYEDGVWVVQAVNACAVREGDWGGRTFKP